MIEHRFRLEGVVKTHLKKIALGQPYGYVVSFGFGPVPDPANGQVGGLGWEWMVLVSIPNPLVGQGDVAGAMPVPGGVLPPDTVFRQIAEFIFGKCLEERDKLTKMPPPVDLSAGAMPGGPAMALSERPN